MRKIFISITIFIILVYHTSCNFINGEEPLQALVDSPCAPPCWQNITPGKTSKQEVLRLSSNIPEFDSQRSTWLGPWNIYTESFRIFFQGNKGEVEIYFIDDFVDSIILYEDLGLTLERALSLYGEPESIIIEKKSAGPSIFLQIHLLYPDIGLLLSFEDGDLETAHIQPGKRIKWIIFFDPERYEATLTEGAPLIDPEAFQNNQYPWRGYENIKFED